MKEASKEIQIAINGLSRIENLANSILDIAEEESLDNKRDLVAIVLESIAGRANFSKEKIKNARKIFTDLLRNAEERTKYE